MRENLFNNARLVELRQYFVEDGVSVAEWARQRNFSLPLVYSVLKGKSRASRGESHRIAVALGLKSFTNRLANVTPEALTAGAGH